MRKKVFLSLFIFVLLFSPPILPGLRLMYVLTLFSGLMIVAMYKREALKIARDSQLSTIMKFLLGLSGYIAVVTLLSGNFHSPYFVDSIGKLLLTGPALGICLIYLILVFKRAKYNINDILKIIVYAGLIQAILSVLTFLFPDLKMFFISIMQHNVGTPALFDQFQVESRLFGFAGDMFDRFGYGMGMLAAIPALLAYNTGRMRYLAIVPLFIITTILNSRTGILILIVTVIPLILLIIKKYSFNMRNAKAMLGSLIIIAITIIGGIQAISGIYETGNDNIKGYTVSNYQSLFDYFSGNTSNVDSRDNTAELLFSNRFWELPDGFMALTFGTGHSKYKVEGLRHSDVGYVNDIWMFGLLGALVAYAILIRFTLGIRKYGSQYKALAIGLLLSFFIYQIKGVALWSANFGIAIHIALVSIILWYYSQYPKESHTKKGNR